MKSFREEALSCAVGVLVLLATLLLPIAARAQSTLWVPDVVGDQLFFVYNDGSPRATFLNVANPSATAVDLEVSFYPDAGERVLVRIPLGAWGNRVINPAAVGGVAGTSGLAVITPVDGPASSTPIVPPEPLAGSFTLANVVGESAFGGNALGRFAVDGAGRRAARGNRVDGTTIRYQRFSPPAMAIPTYYDPRTLDPPEDDGNRVIVVAFEDLFKYTFKKLPYFCVGYLRSPKNLITPKIFSIASLVFFAWAHPTARVRGFSQFVSI